uniref:Putative transmembrane protein n=1 Tax=Ralstonia solanacearum TaxID=305 RepID=A0A0S4TYC1_RALSL
MKRIALAILGCVWGLLVTWVSVYVFNQIHWPEVQSHATGCNDMEHCASHATFIGGMLATLL